MFGQLRQTRQRRVGEDRQPDCKDRQHGTPRIAEQISRYQPRVFHYPPGNRDTSASTESQEATSRSRRIDPNRLGLAVLMPITHLYLKSQGFA